jgi:hypothetical protein
MPTEIELPWQEEHQGDPGEHIVLFPRAGPASYPILFGGRVLRSLFYERNEGRA